MNINFYSAICCASCGSRSGWLYSNCTVEYLLFSFVGGLSVRSVVCYEWWLAYEIAAAGLERQRPQEERKEGKPVTCRPPRCGSVSIIISLIMDKQPGLDSGASLLEGSTHGKWLVEWWLNNN